MVTFLITIFGDSITEYPIFKTKSHDPGSLLCPYSANIVVNLKSDNFKLIGRRD